MSSSKTSLFEANQMYCVYIHFFYFAEDSSLDIFEKEL